MTAGRTLAVNYAAYQAGWLAAVGGAAVGHGAAGAALAGGLTLMHLALARPRAPDAWLVAAALAVGLGVESWQMSAGTYRLLGGEPPAGLPPLWLLALWAQFATTFRFSLQRVMARPWAAALLGAVGGPLAFLAGERLGAVVLWAPVAGGLVRLVVGWGAALCVLSVATRAVTRRWPVAGYGDGWAFTGRRRDPRPPSPPAAR